MPDILDLAISFLSTEAFIVMVAGLSGQSFGFGSRRLEYPTHTALLRFIGYGHVEDG
jgi:hypothetical protein